MRRRRPSTIPQLLRRRRIARRITFALLLLLATSVLLPRLDLPRTGPRGQSAPTASRSANDWADFDRQTFTVRHVADGDTADIVRPDGGRAARVRLIGVDAPELNLGDARPPDHWAGRAREYLLARARDKPVTVRLEPTETRDKYGRLLAYLYLSDNDCLNLALVRDGQAYADRRFRHTMRAQFEQAENAARKKGTGLWQDVTEAQMPEWRQRWLRERESFDR